MKTVKLFFSSSVVEFKTLRLELEAYFTKLNRFFMKHDIYLDPFFCEDYDNSVSKNRKQEKYNEELRASQYFYIIVGKKAGIWTVEEFEEAYKSFLADDKPIIRTYFDKNISDDELEESAKNFKHRVGVEIEHIYSTFDHVDTIKLNLLEVLTNDLLTHSKVSFENGQAMLDNVPIMSLENVPLYSKHPKVQELIAERTKLDNEFVDVSSLLSKSPDNKWLLKQKYALDEKRTKISEQLRTMERDLYDLYKTTEEKRKSGKSINWRERKALELMENGDAISARRVLKDEQWKKDIAFGEEVIEQKKDEIREYISGKETEISIIKATGVTTETEQEIIGIYEEITALAEKHKIELMTMYAYASFLWNQCQYPKGIKVAERLLKYLELEENTSDENIAMLKNLLGNLCNRNNDYKKAEKLYRESLEIRRRLAETNPTAYEPDVAGSCNNLANLLADNNQYDEAEELYREALEKYRRLAKSNPTAYEPDMAMSCNNLANLLADNKRYNEAEELYNESLEIRRRLAETNPTAYEPYLAASCNNLALLLADNNQYDEAEELYRDSLEKYRRLAEANPTAYEPDMAMSCNNLANLLYNKNQYDEAEKLHKKSLEIRRRLAETNPGAYEPYLATSCNNLANLLKNNNRYDEAEKLYRDSLEIYSRLAETNPTAYEPDVAMSCNNLAILLKNNNRYEEAEKLYREALEKYRRLAETNPSAYEPDMAISCNNLANLLKNNNRYDEAEKLYRESLEIRRRLAEANPTAYEPDVAMSCFNYALLLYNHKNDKTAAKAHFEEALGYFEKYTHLEADAQKVRDILKKYF